MESQALLRSQEQAPLSSLSRETKMHDAAQGFVGAFFTQMVGQMFSEANESNEDGFESEMYSSLLAEGMAEKIAASGAAKVMVSQIENILRRQGGLEELKGTGAQAHQTYQSMGRLPMKQQEISHVCATAA